MKATVLFFVLLSPSCFAQVSIDQDAVLAGFKSNLPSGWEMNLKNNILSVSRKDSVLVIYTNNINAPGGDSRPTEMEMKKRFEEDGMKRKFIISWRLEPKWDDEKFVQARGVNDSLLSEVRSLWDKYEIENFYHRAPHTNGKRWEEDHFDPKTKSDSLKLEKYLGQKAALNKQEIIIPEQCSEHYSMFEYMNSFCNDHSGITMDVYPESAKQELWDVCQNANEIFTCE